MTHQNQKAREGAALAAPATNLKPMQIKLVAWPKIDQALWVAAAGPIDILDTHAPAAAWRPATSKNVAKSYGRWLRWLEDQGVLDGAVRPFERATKPRLAAYIAALQATTSTQTVSSYVEGLTMAIARMEPGQESRWLWDIVNKLKRQVQPIRHKRKRIVAVQDLLKLGQTLMAQAVSDDPLQDAIAMRDGLLIALLATRPIRIHNLQMIEIGKHLIKVGNRYEMRFSRAEMKTHKELNTPLPAVLTPAIDHYLEQHRPILLHMAKAATVAAGQALWVTRFGTRMAEISLHKRISELTAIGFGHSINAHLFRDCAATSIALDDPDHVHITMTVLGHSHLTTSQRYYNHALSRNAAEIHQTAICALRKQHRLAASRAAQRTSRGGQ